MTRKKGSTRLINFTIAFLGLVSCARALTINLDEEWELFKDTYKKKYDTKEEEAKRRQIFEDNTKFIAMHNIQENMGLYSFTLGVNDRTDVSDEELEAWGSCYHDSSSYEVPTDEILGEELDEDELMDKTDDDKSKHKLGEDKLKNYFPTEDETKHKLPEDESSSQVDKHQKRRSKHKHKPPEDESMFESSEDASEHKLKHELPHDKSKDKFPKDETEDNPPEDYSMEKPPNGKSRHEPSEDESPSAVEDGVYLDYRKKGMVSPVKDEGKCQACYAFSAMGALEAQMKKKTGQLVPLSEQNIIDCSAKEGNHGCKSGDIFDAYLYVLRNKGVNSLAKYPYTGKDGACNFKKDDIAATIKAIQPLANNEKIIRIKLESKGPISVGLAGSKLLDNYKSGVFDDRACNAGNFSTSALIVGYGTEGGKDYWLLKNSHGTSWGEKGYFRIVRGKNMCRIAERASYPVVP